MIAGKTSSGFAFTVNENLKNDFRIVLAYAAANSDNEGEQARGLVQLVSVVLGENGATAFYKHLAQKDGTIPTDKMMAELGEIIRASAQVDGDVKN